MAAVRHLGIVLPPYETTHEVSVAGRSCLSNFMSILYTDLKTQRHLEDRELNQARSKPDTVDRPVRTAHTFVHHYNSTQYCNTESIFSIFPFLQTNITSQMWPSGGNGGCLSMCNCVTNALGLVNSCNVSNYQKSVYSFV